MEFISFPHHGQVIAFIFPVWPVAVRVALLATTLSVF